MKKLIMLIMVLVVISHSLIGQQVDKHSVTYRGGLSLSERFESFCQKVMMNHNGTDFTQRNRREKPRRTLRKEQNQYYVEVQGSKRR